MMTQQVEFRFYEELNDFLPEPRRKKAFTYEFSGAPAVKDAIEALGVPHCEVDLVLVDGSSQPFDYRLRGGERVAVYPMFEAFDVSEVSLVRPKPLRTEQGRVRFIVDANLGKLAKYLRLFGFDATYDKHADDATVVAESLREKRIIVTRDKGLLKRRAVSHGLWVRSDVPQVQIVEVLERLHLAREVRPFTRCLACNGEFELVDKGLPEVAGLLPRDVHDGPDMVYRCLACRKLFWQGSHYRRMQVFCDDILKVYRALP